MDIFEQASREALRFETPVGTITTEDLWVLPLASKANRANLDDIAVGLHSKLQAVSTVSFVTERKSDDAKNQLKFDIVKHVIDVRLEQNKQATLLAANKEKKQQILAIIAQKQNEQLAGSSLEELTALANAL